MPDVLNAEALEKMVTPIMEMVGGHLPNVLAALAILVVGWLVALIIGKVVAAAFRKIGLNDKLGSFFASPTAPAPDVAGKIGRAAFYLIMLFVLVAFFQTLGLTVVTEPLNAFLNQVFEYAPRLVAGGVLIVIAWVVAKVARTVVSQGLAAMDLDRRLGSQAGDEQAGAEQAGVPVTKTASEGIYWVVWLLFLPAILDALHMPGLLAPVQDLVNKVMSFLPNLFAAAVLFGVGWFIAKVIRKIVSSLLATVGLDRLSDRVGLSQALGSTKLSDLLGLIVYVLILIPVLVGALNALQIDAVTKPASAMLDTIMGSLPGIFAAVLVVGIAYVVGRVASDLITNILTGVGFDKLPASLGLAKTETTEGRTPSQLVGVVVLFAFVLFAVMQALPMMGFDMLAGLMAEMLVFASKILVGVVILCIGLFLAKLAAEAIRSSGVANASVLANVARIAILVLAGSMSLQRMGLADEIVNLAFGLTLGSIAVASAIAFGIGGREAAKGYLERLTRK
ncbi:MAG: mechanosensitive ion channel [Planctomycetota bacterium]|nr:mechanosensitive ion channel [Planctomycetota bacterium]